ncbi:MAG: hypothetical protein C4581_08025 [Nitrospiraceae bacterium]|nr:MAG: hypothetical protein C4581_08025 [Nitrospiraceae bacterium]
MTNAGYLIPWLIGPVRRRFMMKKISLITLLIFCLLPAVQNSDAADIKIPVPPLPPLPPFHLDIRDYFKVPEPDIRKIKDRHIPDEQIPVVLFLAAMAHVPPPAIIDLRQAGRTWMEICRHFGLAPDIFYVPVKEVVKGPPFGKAYGHYKNKPKKEWKNIVLDDDDIINMVNLRFLSDFHKYSPEDIIRMRTEGRNFTTINERFREEKKVRREKEKYRDDDNGRKKQGKPRDKGKGSKNKDD